ncbi:MAG: hypothetical protein ACI9X0_002969 [Kiritimatiellia bacterium]|jgi:hypothetical protein
MTLKVRCFDGKLGVRWQRVRNEPVDTAFLQSCVERICTFPARNAGEDPIVPLGLCKSGVAGLVILALCRRTPN